MATLLAMAPAGAGAAIPVGAELQVNTYTTGRQQKSVITGDADGDFVVVWISGLQDGSSYGVFAQRYASSGARLGGEFQVNAYTSTFQQYAAAAMDPDGDFVIAWTSQSQDGSNRGVFARRFSSDGAAATAELQINVATLGDQSTPAVAMEQNGDFVVAWHAYAQDGYRYGVFARRFASTGTAVGGELQVNTYTAKNQKQPTAAADADGDFVVAWESEAQDGSNAGIFLQRFSSSGTRVGAELMVNAYTPGTQVRPAAAVDPDGDFVVVWTGYNQDGSDGGVFGRRFASSGAPGGELRLNVRTADSQREPRVAIDSAGRFVVVWTSENQDGFGYGVIGRRFSRTGAALETEFQINTATAFHQIDPAAAMEAGGDFVVVWTHSRQDGFDPGDTDIFLQRFAAPVLDVDGDGAAEALTDGLLILRRLFGFSGSSIVAGTVDLVDCTRCTVPDIESYLAALAAQIDVDGDGEVEPLTDGLLIERRLFGFTGAALVAGTVDAAHCTRCTAPAITAYLAPLGP